MMTWKPYYSEGFAAGWRELKLVNIHLRLATDRDIERLRLLIEASVRGLQAGDYSPEQLEGALAAVYAWIANSSPMERILSLSAKARSLPAGVGANAELSAAATSTQGARIRCSIPRPRRLRFEHSSWARRGIGSLILEGCESAAKAEGFLRLEMAATLSGVEFYKVKGYTELERIAVPLPHGEALPVVRMGKYV